MNEKMAREKKDGERRCFGRMMEEDVSEEKKER